MNKLTFLIFVILSYALNAGEYDPVLLKSTNGRTVKVVAVYEASPEGLELSPMPDGPLIGSRKLATITVKWEHIDLNSLTSYPEINSAYQKASGGQTVSMELGPHFADFDAAKALLKKDVPEVTIYYDNEVPVTAPLTTVLTKKDLYKAKKWEIPESAKRKLIKQWNDAYDEFDQVSYRTDFNRLLFDLKKAIRAIEQINSGSAFNISHAESIKAILI
ncbi:hypothetical protein [Coraliomargarita parva]|uniref:hypothetical protein n=1 Tax=Coraliomargarita parva TaxID=3014050 RepID=UPI0022B306D4|nr:hypothetical protein [Coraliomargarita parva]